MIHSSLVASTSIIVLSRLAFLALFSPLFVSDNVDVLKGFASCCPNEEFKKSSKESLLEKSGGGLQSSTPLPSSVSLTKAPQFKHGVASVPDFSTTTGAEQLGQVDSSVLNLAHSWNVINSKSGVTKATSSSEFVIANKIPPKGLAKTNIRPNSVAIAGRTSPRGFLEGGRLKPICSAVLELSRRPLSDRVASGRHFFAKLPDFDVVLVYWRISVVDCRNPFTNLVCGCNTHNAIKNRIRVIAG